MPNPIRGFTLSERHAMRSAFTLVELLVVITIIVVLLAMLAPAMDKAIYQAELAVCGAHQDGIASGVLSYAAENKRHYPHRASKRRGAADMADIIVVSVPGDDRPYLRNHVSLDLLVDPLVEEVDLSPEATVPNQRGVQVHSTVSLWFGIQYSGNKGGKGLFKIGDRLEYDRDRFSTLVSDLDGIYGGTGAFSSHPDAAQVLSPEVYRNEPLSRAASDLGLGAAFTPTTLSRWSNFGVWKRGPVDTNYAFDDGSVQRYSGIRWDEQWHPDGQMLEVLPYNGAPEGSYQHLPRR